MDYKRELTADDPKKKEELAKDVCSFANHIGGVLIVGLAEARGIPSKIMDLGVLPPPLHRSCRPRAAPGRRRAASAHRPPGEQHAETSGHHDPRSPRRHAHQPRIVRATPARHYPGTAFRARPDRFPSPHRDGGRADHELSVLRAAPGRVRCLDLGNPRTDGDVRRGRVQLRRRQRGGRRAAEHAGTPGHTCP
ncbi:ATP-binding protein [Streptomyces sp. DH7]|uniref:ATP-binding protein n=1 Tax=Streptomyces sp. DH7 TaxID=2857006 RepID=UPI0035B019B7